MWNIFYGPVWVNYCQVLSVIMCLGQNGGINPFITVNTQVWYFELCLLALYSLSSYNWLANLIKYLFLSSFFFFFFFNFHSLETRPIKLPSQIMYTLVFTVGDSYCTYVLHRNEMRLVFSYFSLFLPPPPLSTLPGEYVHIINQHYHYYSYYY